MNIEDLKPFKSNEELPEPKVKKGKKDGKIQFEAYGEGRFFMRMNPDSYELVKVLKKPTGILRRHICTFKRKNKAHMATFKKLKDAGIPIIA